MKSESSVIANKYVAVNIKLSLVLTARHVMGVCYIRNEKVIFILKNIEIFIFLLLLNLN